MFTRLLRQYWWLGVGLFVIVLLNWQTISSDLLGIPSANPSPTNISTPQPEWMAGCTADAIVVALGDIDNSKQDFDDAAGLTLQTFKAADYKADSAAVVTAMANLTEHRRAVERLVTPYCIEQTHYSLIGYVRSVSNDIEGCVYYDDCDDLRFGEHVIYDFRSFYRYSQCLAKWPPPSKLCDDDYPYWVQAYNSDGTPRYSPAEEATIKAGADVYRTAAALTQQP